MAKEKESKQVSLNIKEMKTFLTHIIANNRYIQKRGKIPVAVGVEGVSGIGKTSAILQLKDELELECVKLNLAQIEELGDLVGFPIRQFEVANDQEEVWIDEPTMEEYRTRGYRATGKNRMGYCPPQWIAGMKKGGILILDDWNRADVRFVQAVMELIDRQQYISWSLPTDWHIILTSNPDDGDYLVQSIDNAQRTRFINVKQVFEIKNWAEWAEKNGIDGRCINFLLKHPELIQKNVNARSAVMFFNSLTSIPSFDKDLPLIQNIGEGCVGPEFTTLFTQFIQQRLDKMISPEDIVHGEKEKEVGAQLAEVLGTLKSSSYRADIASILVTRLVNYTSLYAEKNDITKLIIDRIKFLVKGGFFTNDLTYLLVRGIYNSNTSKFKNVLADKELAHLVIK